MRSRSPTHLVIYLARARAGVRRPARRRRAEPLAARDLPGRLGRRLALAPLRDSGYRLLAEGLGRAGKPAAVAAVNAEREQAIAAAGLRPAAVGERATE